MLVCYTGIAALLLLTQESEPEMKSNIQPIDSVYSADYQAVKVQPAGKQSFKPFSFGLPTGYWSANPVSPIGVEKEVQRLATIAIKEIAIKARIAGEVEFEWPNSLVDLLATIGPAGRLLRADLEAWTKANMELFGQFLVAVRGHADDSKLASKVQVFAELFIGAAAPKPNWKPNHATLLLECLAWVDSEGEGWNGEESIPARILAKLESFTNEVVTDADAL